jgi:hypothetical protein
LLLFSVPNIKNACGKNEEEVLAGLWCRNLRERENVKGLDINVRIILKRILKMCDGGS